MQQSTISMQTVRTNSGLMPNLDLLRAIAVTLVVLDHTLLTLGIPQIGPWQSAWMGLIGVYMFFVHTCLVLMWSLERHPGALGFFTRRIFRIYPLAIVAVACAALTRAPVAASANGADSRVVWNLANFVKNCLLIQNLTHGRDYMGVLWSLPLEVDMYLLLPLLFVMVRKWTSYWPLLLLWGAAVAADLRYMDPATNNFQMVVPNFLPGVLAYVAFSRRRPTLPAALFPVFLFVLWAGLMSFRTLHWSWIFSLALGLGIASFRQVQNPAVQRASHELAKYSYGIYLSHPFALWIAFGLLAGLPMPLKLAVEFASIAVVSMLSFRFIERPLIDLGSRVAGVIDELSQEAPALEPIAVMSGKG